MKNTEYMVLGDLKVVHAPQQACKLKKIAYVISIFKMIKYSFLGSIEHTGMVVTDVITPLDSGRLSTLDS